VVGGGVGWSYMTGGGGAQRIFHRRRRSGFMDVGGGGVRPNERTLKRRTRWAGVFSGFTRVIHFASDLCIPLAPQS